MSTFHKKKTIYRSQRMISCLDLDTNRYLKLLFADNLDEINKFDEDNKLASTELENLQASATAEIPNIIKYRSDDRGSHDNQPSYE